MNPMTPHTPVDTLESIIAEMHAESADWRKSSNFPKTVAGQGALGACVVLAGQVEEWAARLASLPVEGWVLRDDDVQWIVNDNAELGVKIGGQFFFCYKGRSLVYDDAKHDDGSQMHWRPVFKREFGECIHPVNYADLRSCGHQHYIGTVSLDDSDDWQPLPQPPQDQRQGNEQGGTHE